MTTPLRPLVAIGVGNVLLTDDAVGVRVIESLRELAARDPRALPAGTHLVDGGTRGLDLLGVVRDARGLILVDAVRLGAPAGTVSLLHGDAIVAAGGSRDGRPTSSVGELLAVARLMGWLPEPVAMVGIEVTETGFGADLTPAVDGARTTAMDMVRGELCRMDEPPTTGIQGGGATARMAGATA
jgi:hydrogenase maturation protease